MPLTALARQATIELTVSTKNAVELTNAPTNKQAYWVYLGQREAGKWQTKLFDISNMPRISQVITARTFVYLHNKKPQKISEPDTWDFGKTVKTIKPNSTMQVLDTLRLPGNNLWASVK